MMNFLLLGYGSIGKRHASILREMGHTVVTVDPDKNAGADYRRPAAWDGRHIPWHEDAPEFFGEHDQFDADGVLDCTPPYERPGWRYGAKVRFVEKPLGPLAATEWDFAPIQLGFCYYFLPSLRAFVESLEPHRLYSVTMVAGAHLQDWHECDYRDRYHGTTGGIVQDSMPHSLFIARWILGELELVGKVTGRFSGLDIRTEDTAAVLLRARDTGIPCSILVDYLRRPATSYIEAVTSDGVKRWEMDSREAPAMYREQMRVFCELAAGERRFGFPTLQDGTAVQALLNEVKDG